MEVWRAGQQRSRCGAGTLGGGVQYVAVSLVADCIGPGRLHALQGICSEILRDVGARKVAAEMAKR